MSGWFLRIKIIKSFKFISDISFIISILVVLFNTLLSTLSLDSIKQIANFDFVLPVP
jgi:hypothetical protein